MKTLKLAMASMSTLLVFFPLLTKADVVTQQELDRLSKDVGNQNNNCALTNSIVRGQKLSEYGKSNTVESSWKTVTTKSGIRVSIPWSPTWYVLGKQIPWFDTTDDHSFGAGPFRTYADCSLSREYRVTVRTNQTIRQYFTAPKEGNGAGKVFETFTLNGRKAALVDTSNPMCDEEGIAVEVMKNAKVQTVLISHECGRVDTTMMRMAARIK